VSSLRPARPETRTDLNRECDQSEQEGEEVQDGADELQREVREEGEGKCNDRDDKCDDNDDEAALRCQTSGHAQLFDCVPHPRVHDWPISDVPKAAESRFVVALKRALQALSLSLQ
jgi:hypothetical protein